MRLLKLHDNGELGLVERSGHSIPEYAILSHTWGPDGEEVTYEDLMTGSGKLKSGYDKIRFCGNQAKTDGLQYFWIDTCCINKANFTELSEAINSMFRWYNEAARCYVYLSDVRDCHDSPSTVESAFQNSRWFKRGWTLQELIAPSSVQFFSREGSLLGSKRSRELQIHQITGISVEALQGTPLSQISTTERLLWAAQRQTTVEEDAAYSLLGIFDIQMPLIYGEGRQKALDRLQRKIQKSPGVPIAPNNAVCIIPFERNWRFTGREPQLAQLESMLFTKSYTTKVAIMGLGGVGKTQLVLELLFRTKDKHPDCSIIWIPATNRESLHQAYLDVAQQLGIPGWEDDKEDVKKLVQGYLSKESTGRWLLVFDNADDIDMWIDKAEGSQPLIDYLPRSKHGVVLFTTRDRRLAVKLAQQTVIEVPAMGEDTAAQLLEQCLIDPKLIDNRHDTNALLSQLTYLPLAIVQAAAYINENCISIADYLSLLEDQEEEVIDLLSEEFEDDGRYRDLKNPVATTWIISFEQIRQRDALAAEYLSFMACIEPKSIPQSLLPPGPTRKKKIDAIGTLNAYSFITRRPTDDALDLHRLVHLATRNWLRKEQQLGQSTEKAISRLEEVFPTERHENRSLWRTYLTHVRCVVEFDIANKSWKTRTDLMWRYAMCLHKDGRWDEAEIPLTQVLDIEKGTLGADHPDTLTTMSSLASTYRYQGRWKEAEELDTQVLDTRTKTLGADHPDTMTSMNNLAFTFSNQGRWQEAEELDVQVVDARKQKMGLDHPDTLTSMGNLALTYGNQGRWQEAEELNTQVLDIRKKKLGTDHPDTLTSMHNIASIYRDQGRWQEAEELEVQVVEACKKKMGLDHPETLVSMGNLALTYGIQGRWQEAEELNTQVLDAQMKRLGADHPDTLTCMNNLAFTFWNQKRWEEAEELGVKVAEARKKKLGADHPGTLLSVSNLASTYRDQGRWKEAEELDKQVLDARKKLLGPEHPDTLTSMNNLAATFWEQGRWDEAEELELQALDFRKNKLGAHHPDTLDSMSNLSFTWKNQGKNEEAIRLLSECVQLQQRILPANHPDVAYTSKVLAGWQAEAEAEVEAEVAAGAAEVSRPGS
jgi:tetratricopeptide (TPR) repeat protein